MKKINNFGGFVVIVMMLTGCLGDSNDSGVYPLLPTDQPDPTAVPEPTAGPQPEVTFTAGAAGVGDPYFPNDGNGGYDAKHYILEVRYDPETDQLDGKATINATALQNLSRFNLDLDGLEVNKVSVNGEVASWSHNDTELTIEPAQGIVSETDFEVVVDYGGIPSGNFRHEEEGALILGEPPYCG